MSRRDIAELIVVMVVIAWALQTVYPVFASALGWHLTLGGW